MHRHVSPLMAVCATIRREGSRSALRANCSVNRSAPRAYSAITVIATAIERGANLRHAQRTFQCQNQARVRRIGSAVSGFSFGAESLSDHF